MISNTTFNNAWIFDQAGELSGFSGNITTTTLFGSGSYQVNERLTVTGAAYKTINPAFNSRLSPDKLQMEAQGVSMGVGYRINDNLHIGAEIRMQQGNSTFYAPFANPASPFRNSIYGF
jgi:long-subunit fatty acid transport protein